MTVSPPDLPDLTHPRLFVGNIPSTLPTSSLLRLLSKFGKPIGEVHRPPNRTFAYVSLIPNHTNSLSRCIETLNNTIWAGTVLRIQQARQHYWHRLSAEWKEEQERKEADPITGKEGTAKIDTEDKISLGALWKGRHTRFEFEDVAEAEAVKLLTWQEESGKMETGDGAHVDGLGVNQAGKDVKKVARKGPKGKDAAVSSALALFGLGATSVVPKAGNQGSAVDKGLVSVDKGLPKRPTKRQRTEVQKSPPFTGDGGVSDAAQEVNSEAEKETALAVLRSMFPECVPSKRTREELIAANRRPGLFRNIRSSETPGLKHKSEVRSRGARNSLNSRIKHVTSLSVHTPQTAPDISRGHRNLRRAGLYRMLTSPSTAAPQSPLPKEQD